MRGWQPANEGAMEKFVRRKNVEHFQHLLDEIVMDENERQRVLRLLAEEQQKQNEAGDLRQRGPQPPN